MNREQLRSLSPAKLRILLDLMENSKGKGPETLMPLLLQANQKMQQQGIRFTPEESKLVLDLLKQDMTPAEVKKVEMMQSLLASWQQ
ncbi:MAG: hypothetical protein NC089_12230 [Bacteroides sp.]|nr:hypothetical protein [Bacteroides sp.]MCM1550689.1 hypothetical protein [Clostridium sp.]